MRRGLTLTLLVGLASVLLALPASAHDVLVGSDPKAGATVSSAPRTVTLEFNLPVQNGPNQVTVVGPGSSTDEWQADPKGSATVNGDNVSATVNPLGPAGEYTVSYRVISADGHPVYGEVSFMLSTAGTGKPDTKTAQPPAGQGIAVWVWIVAAVVVLGAGLATALRFAGRAKP
ncbi:MAG: copper resistance protein CopC [Sciscionella sp.]|nr:copper resistance protein CopC [Sciscionella sp.]